jgi:hypothetical protein
MYGNEVLFRLWIVSASEVVVMVVHDRLWNFEGRKEDVMDLDEGTVLRRNEESMVYGNPNLCDSYAFVIACLHLDNPQQPCRFIHKRAT